MDIMIEKKCPSCAEVTNIVIDSETYAEWCNGTLIQNAMPELTSTEREILITGFCENCQYALFEDVENE